MQPSEDLFQLIHSLNGKEKWHFKKYSGRYGQDTGKNYLRLFEAIARQKTYDEKAITRQFKKDAFTRQLSVAKNYLYNLIMESLQVYNARNSREQQIRQMAHRVQILFNKSLYTQAQRLLQKTQKLAQENQLTNVQLDLIPLESYLTAALRSEKEQEAILAKQALLEKVLLKTIEETNEYTRLLRRLLPPLSRQGLPQSKEEAAFYRPFFEHPLLKRKDPPDAPAARRTYYMLLSYRQALVFGDLQAAGSYYKKVIELLDSHPHLLPEHSTSRLNTYMAHLFNFLSISVLTRKFDVYFLEKLEQLDKMRSPDKLSSFSVGERAYVEASLFVNYCLLAIKYHTFSGNQKQGNKLLHIIEKELPKHRDIANPALVIDLYFFAGLFAFYNGKYNDALDWFNRLLNHSYAQSFPSTYPWAKIFTLLAHYELGNDQLLEYQIKSIYRYLLKTSRLYKIEKLLVRFFRNELPNVQNEKTLVIVFKELHGQLKKLALEPFENNTLNLYVLLSWIESRTQHKGAVRINPKE